MMKYLLSGIVGLVLGLVIYFIYSKLGLNKAQAEAAKVVTEAQEKAKNIQHEAAVTAKMKAYETKMAAEEEIKNKKAELQKAENKLLRKEDSLNFREENLNSKEKQIADKDRKLTEKLNVLDKKEQELNAKIDAEIVELERVASMSTEEARKELMSAVETKMANEITAYIREQEEEAKATANEKARDIIGTAIQRYAQEETQERTVSVVQLPSEEMKGRIIGREGRNIKAIEQATGVDLIIDDTPETITVSCFDPIRREIARQSLENLIKDGRIHPGRIEEVVKKVTSELDETIKKAGEDAVFKLGIGRMDREMIKYLGRLKYRYSYGQNVLDHSMEVASLAGMMAAELGLNQSLAKRAGLLHDIGKAVDFEVEGSHVELGAKLAKKHGEDQIVLNAIESHHGDVEAKFVISNLVAAADTLSAARPGARYESLQNYVERLEKLEEIANSFDGIDKTFAIQAGREVRVMAIPEQLDDAACHRVARAIKERIESEMTYPGQIKVTVIRETRAQETAK